MSQRQPPTTGFPSTCTVTFFSKAALADWLDSLRSRLTVIGMPTPTRAPSAGATDIPRKLLGATVCSVVRNLVGSPVRSTASAETEYAAL